MRTHRGKGRVKVEAEMRVRLPRARDTRSPQKLEEARGDAPKGLWMEDG